MATFEKLRISLARDEVPSIFDEITNEDTRRSRRQYLEDAFSESRSFLHARTGQRIDFLPISIDGDYAGGIFRKQAPVPLHNETLERYDAENYEGAVFLISLNKDQISWMQFNRKLGSTKSILESFFDHLLKKTDLKDWNVFVRYIEDEKEYFEVIRTRRSEIAEISFTFIPPNALSADDEVYNFIRTIHNEAHPSIQKHVYKAEPGQMDPDTEHMNASARVAMAGGGDAEVRDNRRRVLYGKSQGKVSRDVPDDDLPTPTPEHAPFMRRVRDWLFGS